MIKSVALAIAALAVPTPTAVEFYNQPFFNQSSSKKHDPYSSGSHH